MRIAMLSTVFIGEYGVTRIVANQLPYLVADGHQVDLYVCDLDRSLVPSGVRAVRIPTHFRGVREALRAGNYDIVVACTDPFYKILADLKLSAVTVGYEHGYIPVELTIPEEREQHRKMVEARVTEIYPALSCVITISRYAVDYIRWPAARVLYNGGDHFARYRKDASRDCGDRDCGSPKLDGKIPQWPSEDSKQESPRKIRVLMVSRFRTTEWNYKGLDDLCRLSADLGHGYEVMVVGGGDESTYARLKDAGIVALPPVKDPECMERLYESCHVLVSFSRCEMFNLPLVEAGFAHRPSLALNVCAHPEVTPFVFSDYEGIRDYLKGASIGSLEADGERMFEFVDKRFRSETNGRRFAEIMREICPNPGNRRESLRLKFYWMFWNVRDFIRMKVYRKLRGR